MKYNLPNTCLLIVLLILNSTKGIAVNPMGSENQIFKPDSAVIHAFPFSSTEVKLNPSWIKQREILNANYLHELNPDRLLYSFRVNAGIKPDAKPLEGWESPECGLRGHFVGHYLSACAEMIEKNGDTLLNKRIKYIVNALSECQQKLGGKYLSAFPESEFDTLEKKYGGVWAPYYTYHKIMQGLLDVYTLTGNKKAYQIVQNMADYVKSRMDKLPEAEIEKYFSLQMPIPPTKPEE